MSVTNGVSVNLTTTGTQTEVAYMCDIGSSLKGSPQSKCLPDGTWEVIDSPSCGMQNHVITESLAHRWAS